MNNPNEPTFFCDEYSLHWQMTRWEKVFLSSFLEKIKPAYAIEVGTDKGGSLQVLAEHCERVVSIEISEESKKSLEGLFDNVDFLVGDSKKLLPQQVKGLASNSETCLVLIDGDHSRSGVKADIENVLSSYAGGCELFVLCHDSFNPDCRAGMIDVDYSSCPYVHFVEIDFIPGVYHYVPFDTAEERSMWAGLALIHIRPGKRTEPLVVRESQQGTFNAIYKESVHAERAGS